MKRDETHVVRKALAISDKKKGKGRGGQLLPRTWNELSSLEVQTTQNRLSCRLKTKRADPKWKGKKHSRRKRVIGIFHDCRSILVKCLN